MMKKPEDKQFGGGGGGYDRDRGPGGGGGGQGGPGGASEKRSFQRRRGCRFCAEPGLAIDYKDRYLFTPFMTERFKIVPRRISGNCALHQRELSTSMKRARHMAIIPYTTAQYQ